MPRSTSPAPPAPIVMSALSVAIRKRYANLGEFASAVGVSRPLVSMVLTRQRPLSGVLAERARALGFADHELSVAPITDLAAYVDATVSVALWTAARELGLPPEVAERALASWRRGELDGTVPGDVLGSPLSPDRLAS